MLSRVTTLPVSYDHVFFCERNQAPQASVGGGKIPRHGNHRGIGGAGYHRNPTNRIRPGVEQRDIAADIEAVLLQELAQQSFGCAEAAGADLFSLVL